MAKVIIPSPLRKHTDGVRDVQVKGENLSDVMRELTAKYPGLEPVFAKPALLSIFINGTMLRKKPDAWPSVVTGQDDEITLIIPIAGG